MLESMSKLVSVALSVLKQTTTERLLEQFGDEKNNQLKTDALN